MTYMAKMTCLFYSLALFLVVLLLALFIRFTRIKNKGINTKGINTFNTLTFIVVIFFINLCLKSPMHLLCNQLNIMGVYYI